MYHKVRAVTGRSIAIVMCMVLTTAALSVRVAPRAYAANTYVGNRYDRISNPGVGEIASHLVGFSYTNFAVPVGSVVIEFCSNDPLPGTSCTAPSGFTLAAAIVNSQSGETGFSIHGSSTVNRLVLTRPASVPVSGDSSYQLANVRNPNTLGTYYVRIQTFTSTDATGLDVEAGGIAITTNDALTIATEVPPYIRFCVSVTITAYDCSTASSYYIDFGEFSKVAAKSASSQMVAASNAAYGYSIFAAGTTFTSGNNIIPAMSTPAGSTVGVSQFGINLRANTSPSMGLDPVGPGTATPTANYGNPNLFMFHPGDSVVSSVTSQDFRKYTVTYLVNIGESQPAGIYATTITYICLANF